MTQEPLDEQYFNWLYDQVRPETSTYPPLPYIFVCGHMHQMVFDWRCPNDDNRAADGKELRYVFIEEQDLDASDCKEWLSLDASIFEMIVALCLRCNFIAPLGMNEWFGIFLNNLRLSQYANNGIAEKDEAKINRAIRKMNDRAYGPSGRGGLFPLRKPDRDQRKIELWYQMAAYMAENDMY
jgi:hypothetical protein